MRGESVIAIVLAGATVAAGGYAILRQGSQITDHAILPSTPAPASNAPAELASPAPTGSSLGAANPRPFPSMPAPLRPQAKDSYAEANVRGPREIYLCRTYSGGRFYSDLVCSQQNALVERIVPGNPALPFEDQVRLAEQAEAQRLASAQAEVRRHVDHRPRSDSSRAECDGLYEQVKRLDDDARQTHTPPYQDWLRAQRNKLTDRIFSIGC